MQEHPHTVESPKALRLQKCLLRLTALVLFTGFPGALLPGVAAQKFSWLMGLDQPVMSPLLIYLSGNAGFVYVAFGVMVWAISNDPLRYQALSVLVGWVLLVGSPAYLSIDLQSKLPLWWVALDTFACLLFGVVILWTSRSLRQPCDRSA